MATKKKKNKPKWLREEVSFIQSVIYFDKLNI